VHPSPDQALSDGAQSLTLRAFREMMDDLQPYLEIRDGQRTGPQLVAAGGAD
jgi:3-deoxy-D-arabino-heptulosonate 7-phosphate (DAHP) synthase